jgi:hypothetical protein
MKVLYVVVGGVVWWLNYREDIVEYLLLGNVVVKSEYAEPKSI